MHHVDVPHHLFLCDLTVIVSVELFEKVGELAELLLFFKLLKPEHVLLKGNAGVIIDIEGRIRATQHRRVVRSCLGRHDLTERLVTHGSSKVQVGTFLELGVLLHDVLPLNTRGVLECDDKAPKSVRLAKALGRVRLHFAREGKGRLHRPDCVAARHRYVSKVESLRRPCGDARGALPRSNATRFAPDFGRVLVLALSPVRELPRVGTCRV